MKLLSGVSETNKVKQWMASEVIFTAGGGAANEIYGANAWSEVKFKANSPPALRSQQAWIPQLNFNFGMNACRQAPTEYLRN